MTRRQLSASLLTVLLVTIGCDSSPARPHPGTTDGGRESGTPRPVVDLSKIGDRAVDSLDPDELRALCEERARRVDPCAEQARKATASPTDCETALRECRTELGDAGFVPDCSGSSLFAGNCPTTVDQYLTCAGDFGEALDCALGGRILAPPSCEGIRNDCPPLSRSFFIDGVPPSCTPEESAGKPPDTNDDIHGVDACRPRPSRFVALGDSIAACAGSLDVCAPALIADHLRTHGIPDLAFETHAVDGSKVADLLGQAAQVQGGPGHVYVWMFCVGNDLPDAYTGATARESLVAGYRAVFEYFTDEERFPDGATFLLNTQFNPYDECRVPGANVYPPDVDAFIRDVNQELFLDVAEARPDTVAVDQLPDFLGHGNNANYSGCPYCGSDNTSWLGFGPHPNATGQGHIAEKWYVALDVMMNGCDGGRTP